MLLQEIKEAHDQIVKDAKELPEDIPSFDDEGAQIQLENAATDVSVPDDTHIKQNSETNKSAI
jgi:hypothetical protein